MRVGAWHFILQRAGGFEFGDHLRQLLSGSPICET